MNDMRAATNTDCALLGFRLLATLLIGIHGWWRSSASMRWASRWCMRRRADSWSAPAATV